MTTRRASTSRGSAVTWEQTGQEPNVTVPDSPHPIGSLYRFGCGHSVHNVRWSAGTTHASNCNR